MTTITSQQRGLTVARLQKADWKLIFAYQYNDRGAGFKTFACDALPGITVTHDKKIGASKTLIYYTVNKQRTDSPWQACKIYNEKERQSAS